MSLDDKTAQEIIDAFDLAPLEGEGGYYSKLQSAPEGMHCACG